MSALFDDELDRSIGGILNDRDRKDEAGGMRSQPQLCLELDDGCTGDDERNQDHATLAHAVILTLCRVCGSSSAASP